MNFPILRLFNVILALNEALQDIWNLQSRYLGSHFDFIDKQCGQ